MKSPGSTYHTADGRLCEVTSGCFAEAKQEKRWHAVGPHWSDLADRYGSIAGPRERPLTGVRSLRLWRAESAEK